MDSDESLAIIADAQKRIAENTRSLDATTRSLDANLQFLSRLQAYALAMLIVGLVVSVVGLGGIAWLLTQHQRDSAAMQQLVLQNTQTIAAQTRALLERRPER